MDYSLFLVIEASYGLQGAKSSIFYQSKIFNRHIFNQENKLKDRRDQSVTLRDLLDGEDDSYYNY